MALYKYRISIVMIFFEEFKIKLLVLYVNCLESFSVINDLSLHIVSN